MSATAAPERARAPAPPVAEAAGEPAGEVETRLRRAALACFVAKGFHGTSMRDVAREAGCSVSHAYYYYPSKGAILFRLMRDITAELDARLAAAEDRAGPDPARRLAALVRAHVLLHTGRQDESFIGNSELRSLDADRLAEVMVLRDRVAARFLAAVAAGVAAGDFACPTPRETARAIVTMTTAVATWYRADGPQSPETVAGQYADMALRLVGAGAGKDGP